MKSTRVSDAGGRYAPGVASAGVFTPDQLRYIQEELEKIAAVVGAHDEKMTTNAKAIEALSGENVTYQGDDVTYQGDDVTYGT